VIRLLREVISERPAGSSLTLIGSRVAVSLTVHCRAVQLLEARVSAASPVASRAVSMKPASDLKRLDMLEA
jgi:hypothetical protein